MTYVFAKIFFGCFSTDNQEQFMEMMYALRMHQQEE